MSRQIPLWIATSLTMWGFGHFKKKKQSMFCYFLDCSPRVVFCGLANFSTQNKRSSI